MKERVEIKLPQMKQHLKQNKPTKQLNGWNKQYNTNGKTETQA